MDAIMTGFLVVAATAAVAAALLAWWGRPWTAAAVAVVALLAATPLAQLLPDTLVVAGLLCLVVVVGWAVWPRPGRANRHHNARHAGTRGEAR